LQQTAGVSLVATSLVVLIWVLAEWAVVMPTNNAALKVKAAIFLLKVFMVIP
jgi:hypothetical protein